MHLSMHPIQKKQQNNASKRYSKVIFTQQTEQIKEKINESTHASNKTTSKQMQNKIQAKKNRYRCN